MSIRIETDAVFNQESEQKKTIEGVNTINTMIKEAFTTVSQQPLLLPLYRTMIEAVVASIPRARMFENVLEQTFNNISKDLQKPIEDTNQQLQNQLIERQTKATQEKNLLKHKELAIKAFAEHEKARINRAELRLKQEQSHG